MNQKSFTQLYWGFLFMMLDFRIQGIDILPDTVGYILFALAFYALASNSGYFDKAFKMNLPMIVLSLFSVYEKQEQGSEINMPGININFGNAGTLTILGNAASILISIASWILSLLIVYYLFMGIKEMSGNVHRDLYEEADRRWNQYLMLQIGVLLGFVIIFIPGLNFLYVIGILVASIILMLAILRLMKRCGERL